MLKEIHTWFVENLQDRPGSTPPAGVQRHDAAPAAETPLTEIRFEVYAESPDGLTLLCDTTSLHPKWNEKRSGTEGSEPAAQRQIFQCQCSDGNAATASHSGTLEAFGRKIATPVNITPHTLTYVCLSISSELCNEAFWKREVMDDLQVSQPIYRPAGLVGDQESARIS